VTDKAYRVKRITPLNTAPAASPSNILQKLTFRLHLDKESGAVAEFTQAALANIQTFKPDIIVAINGPLQVRILESQNLQAKIVAFGHAGIGYHDKHTLQAKPDLFVALTKQAEIWAKRIASPDTKVVYIPNPLGISMSKSRVVSNLPSPTVLTVSRLSAYKNIRNIIRAIKQTHFSYLLIGDGEESGSIARDLSKLASDFKWIKQVENSDISSYYKSADIFCFTPDPQEAFGMVYLEAMSAGLPIVASDDPIRRELIREKGIYVDPHDHVAIAQGLVLAAKKKKLDYTQELKPYELSTITKQIEGVFHALIS
jgi:glycosyltransferase involved in cell wall biosynthesis